jgi:putative transposon-encoded protein
MVKNQQAATTGAQKQGKDKEAENNAAPKAKFEVYGEEMIEKEVRQSGNSGRVYLPPEWVGKNVKIIRID